MKEIGQLFEADDRYELRIPEKGLIVRGDHPEWVLQAASEVLATTERLEAESKVDELESLLEFEAATSIEVDAARYAMKERFETIPQCIVTLGKMDYRWAAKEGRERLSEEFDGHTVKRINDLSLTFHDSFLENEAGVDTTTVG